MTHLKAHKIWLSGAALALLLASCKVSQQRYQRLNGAVRDDLYRGVHTTDTATIASIPWKQFFTDPHLQALIEEGLQNNLDLKVAVARMKAAEANFRQSKLAFFPTLSANAQGMAQKVASTTRGNTNTQFYELYGASSWEVDIWGKFRSARRAQLNALLESEAYKRAVQTQLIADIANSYYALLAYDAQLSITQQTVANRQEDVNTIQVLKEGDVVTGAAVVQSAANLYSAQVTIPDIRQNIRQTENSISLLLGHSSDTIQRSSLDEQAVSADLRTGVPAQLLANRPDVQEAEYQLRYYFELTNVARAYFYPTLSITAQGGLSNANLANLFDASSVFGSVVGNLMQPIFNQGLNKQRLRVAQANQEEALANFQKAVLNAGQEVSNALFSYQAGVDKAALRAQQISNLEKAVDYTKELLRYTSNTNYTDVLTSEQSLLAAQLNGISDKLQQLQAVVTLYASLGGGWK